MNLSLLLILATGTNQIVVPTFSTTGVPKSVGPLITELVLEALLNRHGVKALGPSDVKDMLSVEQQRQLMGCDQSSCMAQLAGAMGAQNLVSGMIGKLGDTYVVTLKLVDTETAKVSARASRRFGKIDQAPDAVGPLVDDLLKQRPRVQAATPHILVKRREQQKKKKVMSVKAFCEKSYPRYRSALAGRYSKSLQSQRKKMLEDMMWTPFLKEFRGKAQCISSRSDEVASALQNAWLQAKEPADAKDAARRAAEWREMNRTLALLVEAYELGLEKEKNGTGARPIQLPFAVEEKKPEAAMRSAKAARFEPRFREAQKTLKQALSAVNANDKKRFVALWSSAKKREGKAPRDMWIEALRYSDEYELDTCPFFILDQERLTQGLQQLDKDGRVVGCVRKVHKKTGATERENVLLEKRDGRWRIARWK